MVWDPYGHSNAMKEMLAESADRKSSGTCNYRRLCRNTPALADHPSNTTSYLYIDEAKLGSLNTKLHWFQVSWSMINGELRFAVSLHIET